jgi:uncharacterized protein YjiK
MNKKKFFLLFFIILSILFVYFSDLDDQIKYKIFHNKDNNLIKNSSFIYEFKEIKEIKDNLSGITYSPKTNTLFAISNSPRYIYELDKEGNFLRKIYLDGFKDTEDITHIKDDLFAIVDEELNGFFLLKIDENTKIIYKKDSLKEFTVDVKTLENFGLEGISYDLENYIFYLVNERNPKKVITVKGFMNNNPIVVKENFEIAENNDYLGDFAAIYFDNKSKNIYILSEETTLLGRVDDNKDFGKYLDLSANKISLAITNPEGITKDSDGNFYIVGEPNHFLSIKKR